MSNDHILTTEERNAIEGAYINCQHILKYHISSMLRDQSLCGDCENETVLCAAQNINKFLASYNREGWLIRASTFVVYRMIKKEQHFSCVDLPIEELSIIVQSNIVDHISDPFGKWQMINRIRRHLSKASGNFLMIVIKENKSNKELAKLLNISESAVRSRWKRLIDEIDTLPDKVKEKFYFL